MGVRALGRDMLRWLKSVHAEVQAARHGVPTRLPPVQPPPFRTITEAAAIAEALGQLERSTGKADPETVIWGLEMSSGRPLHPDIAEFVRQRIVMVGDFRSSWGGFSEKEARRVHFSGASIYDAPVFEVADDGCGGQFCVDPFTTERHPPVYYYDITKMQPRTGQEDFEDPECVMVPTLAAGSSIARFILLSAALNLRGHEEVFLPEGVTEEIVEQARDLGGFDLDGPEERIVRQIDPDTNTCPLAPSYYRPPLED